MALTATFWGVRGSIACGGAAFSGMGGNTSCVVLEDGETAVILDAGTGLRAFAETWTKRCNHRAAMLITHAHMDHVIGLPFFRPFYCPSQTFDLYCGPLAGALGLKDALKKLMQAPLFPVPLEVAKANLAFHDLAEGESFSPLPGVEVQTRPLNHPGGATGYRIEIGGKVIAYVTDTEHFADRMDPNVLDLMAGADLAIYDAMYTPEQYPDHVGWGHSTWEAGVAAARAAGAKSLALFHHEPDADDATLAAIEAKAQAVWPHVFMAREGQRISFGEAGTVAEPVRQPVAAAL